MAAPNITLCIVSLSSDSIDKVADLLSAGFGKRIRRIREALALSQHRLAVLAGLTATGVAMIERGERECSLNTAIRLTMALCRYEASVDAEFN